MKQHYYAYVLNPVGDGPRGVAADVVVEPDPNGLGLAARLWRPENQTAIPDFTSRPCETLRKAALAAMMWVEEQEAEAEWVPAHRATLRLDEAARIRIEKRLEANPLTLEEAAALFTGAIRGAEPTLGLEERLKASGLVAIFGLADCAILRGAFTADLEIGDQWDDIALTREGPVTAFEECHGCDMAARAPAAIIRRRYYDSTVPDRPVWAYATDLPHATFDVFEIDEDRYEVYCRGIVLRVEDLPPKAEDVPAELLRLRVEAKAAREERDQLEVDGNALLAAMTTAMQERIVQLQEQLSVAQAAAAPNSAEPVLWTDSRGHDGRPVSLEEFARREVATWGTDGDGEPVPPRERTQTAFSSVWAARPRRVHVVVTCRKDQPVARIMEEGENLGYTLAILKGEEP